MNEDLEPRKVAEVIGQIQNSLERAGYYDMRIRHVAKGTFCVAGEIPTKQDLMIVHSILRAVRGVMHAKVMPD